MSISTTERGNGVLCLDGHEYVQRKDRSDGERLVWRCRHHKKFKCKATVITSLDRVLVSRQNSHSHNGDPIGVFAKSVLANIRAAAATSDGSTRVIVGAALREVDDETMCRLPKRSAMEDNVRRVRRKKNPTPPNPLSIDFIIPEEYQDIILHDTGREDPHRIIAIGHQMLLQYCDGVVMGDGTFGVVPNMFFQLYTLHSRVGTSYPPCLYFLLPNKSQQTYVRMIGIFKELRPNATPTTILVDFEAATINAFQEEFPTAEIKGCYFHLCQSVVRKVSALGLKSRFETDPDFSLMVRCLPALAFVPLDELSGVFDTLSDAFPDEPACGDLINYFQSTYISGERPGRRTAAMFPPDIWNHAATAALCVVPKTTNAVEGFHNGLKSIFMSKHPTIWKLFSGLRVDIDMHRLTEANFRMLLTTGSRSNTKILQYAWESRSPYIHKKGTK